VNILNKKKNNSKKLRIWWRKIIGNKEKKFIKKVKEKVE